MRKLTLLIEDDVYEGLHRVAGRGQIGRFVSEKVRPYLGGAKSGRIEDLAGLFRNDRPAVTPSQVKRVAAFGASERYLKSLAPNDPARPFVAERVDQLARELQAELGSPVARRARVRAKSAPTPRRRHKT